MAVLEQRYEMVWLITLLILGEQRQIQFILCKYLFVLNYNKMKKNTIKVTFHGR